MRIAFDIVRLHGLRCGEHSILDTQVNFGSCLLQGMRTVLPFGVYDVGVPISDTSNVHVD